MSPLPEDKNSDSPPEIQQKVEEPQQKNENQEEQKEAAVVSEEEGQNDDDILAACIQMGMRGKRFETHTFCFLVCLCIFFSLRGAQKCEPLRKVANDVVLASKPPCSPSSQCRTDDKAVASEPLVGRLETSTPSKLSFRIKEKFIKEVKASNKEDVEPSTRYII